MLGACRVKEMRSLHSYLFQQQRMHHGIQTENVSSSGSMHHLGTPAFSSSVLSSMSISLDFRSRGGLRREGRCDVWAYKSATCAHHCERFPEGTGAIFGPIRAPHAHIIANDFLREQERYLGLYWRHMRAPLRMIS